ncbi:peptide deformylase [Planctomycetota bacterium]
MILNDFNIGQLNIRCYPDPILRQPAQPVQEISSEIVALVDRMTDLMLEANGIGLAAPQLGVPLQVVILSLTGKGEHVETFINPELDGFEGDSEVEEGCLSLPGVRGLVRRPAICRVSAQDLEGSRFVMDMVELGATAVQHETDHLQGKLFIDRLSTISRMACRKVLKQLEQQYSPR